MNKRLSRALHEFSLLKADTCPCKREVVLVEALHGYAESWGYKLAPIFIGPDGTIPFEPLKQAGNEAGSPVSQRSDGSLPAPLAPLVEALGHPGKDPVDRIAAAALSAAMQKSISM